MHITWLLQFCALTESFSDFDISTSTYLGDGSDQEAVVGVAIQSNGNLIVAANAGPQTPVLKNAARIGFASTNSLGCVIRLDESGKNVLSAVCVADQLHDLALDSSDRVYVAAGQQGALSLEANLQKVRWTTPAITSGSNLAYSHRIDVGGDVVAILASNAVGLQGAIDLDVTPGQGYIQVLNLDGVISSQFRGGVGVDRNALDLVVHASLQLIVAVGWKQANDNPVGGPVQIPWVNGYSYTGDRLWVGYDWHTNRFSLDGRYLNEMSVAYRNVSADGNVTVVFRDDKLLSNNMADGRLSRAALGEDGAVVIVGHAAGGNNLYRYEPMQVLKLANQSGFDYFTSYAGSVDQHLAWVGRFQVTRTSIQLTTGVPVVARLSAIRPNTLHAQGGGVASDIKGRVYLGGISAHGLPFWPNQAWKAVPGEVTLNPFSVSDYTGGAFFLALRFNPTRSQFTQRDYCGRLVYGLTKAVAVRTISGAVRIIYGGQADMSKGSIFTADPLQPLPGFGKNDGFFVVHRYGAINSAPALAARTGLGEGPLNLAGQQVDVQIRNSRPTRIDMDLDGDSTTTDARFLYAFSLTNPLTPVRGFAYNQYNFTYSGPPLYGGLLLDIVSLDTTKTQVPWNRYESYKDELVMIFADYVNPGKQQTYSRGLVFTYTKDLFPEHNQNTVYSFDDSSFLSFTFEQWHIKDGQGNTIMSKHLRYVVLEGDQFFVSETSLPWLGFGYQYYAHTLSFAKPIRWALWSVPNDLNFDPAAATWGNVNFQNVRAVGYLLENDARYQIPWIQPIPNSNPPKFVSAGDQPTSASDWHKINGWNIQMAFNRSVNRPPVAVVTVASRVVRVGEPMLFNASASYDPDGYVGFVSWDFGDFTVSSGPLVNHTFAAAGPYQVVCFVWDNLRVITNFSLTVHVVRGTATNAETSRIVACWWGDPIPGNAQTVFAFYSTRSSFFAKGQELDGDGAANDALCYMPYANISRPLSGSPYRGTKLFGGFRFESANSATSALGGNWPEHLAATHNNPALTYLWNYKGIQLHAIQYLGQDGVRARLWSLWAIDKTDFLNDGDLFVVSFDAQSRLIAGPIFLAGKNGESMRFALRDSDQWWVSQRSWQANDTFQFNLATNTGLGDPTTNPPLDPSPSIIFENPGAGQWAAWDPITAAMKTPTTNFVVRTFTNITALGVVVEVPQWTTTKTSPTGYFPGFGIAGLELQAVVGEQRVPPSASFVITPTSGMLPLIVNFDGSSSTPAATIVRYFWDMGDGKTYQGLRGTYNFALPGTYPVNLIVTDRFGQTSNITKFVTVTDGAGTAGAVLGFLGPKELRVAAEKSVILFVTRQAQKIGSVSVSWNLSGKKVYSSGTLAWDNGNDELRNVSVVFPTSETAVTVALHSPYGGATVLPQNRTVTLRLIASACTSLYPALLLLILVQFLA